MESSLPSPSTPHESTIEWHHRSDAGEDRQPCDLAATLESPVVQLEKVINNCGDIIHYTRHMDGYSDKTLSIQHVGYLRVIAG